MSKMSFANSVWILVLTQMTSISCGEKGIRLDGLTSGMVRQASEMSERGFLFPGTEGSCADRKALHLRDSNKPRAFILLLVSRPESGNESNREAMVLRANNQKAKWMLPGGECEVGETNLDCAIREFIEETPLCDVTTKSGVRCKAEDIGYQTVFKLFIQPEPLVSFAGETQQTCVVAFKSDANPNAFFHGESKEIGGSKAGDWNANKVLNYETTGWKLLGQREIISADRKDELRWGTAQPMVEAIQMGKWETTPDVRDFYGYVQARDPATLRYRGKMRQSPPKVGEGASVDRGLGSQVVTGEGHGKSSDGNHNKKKSKGFGCCGGKPQ